MTDGKIQVGVLGGTGLYEMEGLTDVKEVYPDTPFGKPSDRIVIGTVGGARVAFLPRHGRGHIHDASQIPVRANIWALKMLGVERLLSVGAVGSLREMIRPMDLVVPDQLIDRTTTRANSFFGKGITVHVAFAQPYCADLSERTYRAARAAQERSEAAVHKGGTYIVIEGPAFSTRAESFLYRSWGADIIGMTALPEAKLAREAEMCYANMSYVTDYDSWREHTETVTVEMVVQNLNKTVATARQVLRRLLPGLGGERTCACGHALRDAIATSREAMTPEIRERYAPLVGKYV